MIVTLVDIARAGGFFSFFFLFFFFLRFVILDPHRSQTVSPHCLFHHRRIVDLKKNACGRRTFVQLCPFVLCLWLFSTIGVFLPSTFLLKNIVSVRYNC